MDELIMCNFCHEFEEKYYIYKIKSKEKTINLCTDCGIYYRLKCINCGNAKRIYGFKQTNNIIDVDNLLCLKCERNLSSSQS